VSQVSTSDYVHFDGLLKQAADMPAMPVAVVAPEKADALAGPVQAAEAGLITPILIGDAALIAQVAVEIGVDISGYEVIDIADHSDAAARGVALVHEGRAAAVMKGHLHTDVLLRHVVKREGGLRAGRRLSHVFICDVPGEARLLLVTDGAINIAPDLETKADITQSGIDLARTLGIETPNVAVLSAVETVNPKVQSTIDADALVQMAKRGEITGGVVEGPLSMDIAVDQAAAVGKGLASQVAGRAEVMIMPNIEAGNMFAKALTHYARAEKAGIVLGASVPVILTSRSDGELARLVSCAVAVLYAARKDKLA
jgi:phosphate butyryltransferase